MPTVANTDVKMIQVNPTASYTFTCSKSFLLFQHPLVHLSFLKSGPVTSCLGMDFSFWPVDCLLSTAKETTIAAETRQFGNKMSQPLMFESRFLLPHWPNSWAVFFAQDNRFIETSQHQGGRKLPSRSLTKYHINERLLEMACEPERTPSSNEDAHLENCSHCLTGFLGLNVDVIAEGVITV